MNNHYDPGICVIEKFNANKVWSAALYDADQQGYPYLKRFTFEATSKKLNYLGENKDSRPILLTSPEMAGRTEREIYQRITALGSMCMSVCYSSVLEGKPDDIEAMKPVLYDIVRRSLKAENKKSQKSIAFLHRLW